MRSTRKRKPRASSSNKRAAIISSPPKGTNPESSRTCKNFTKTSRAFFPPQDTTSTTRTSEINRGRTEERALTAFAVSPSRVQFPFAEQAAQLVRHIQIPGQPPKDPEIEFLITSRPASQMNAAQMLRADRKYWGIENGLHLRLDVIAGEDRSRVRHRNAALNLAVIRRAVISVAVHWIRCCKNPRQATTSGFYDFMTLKNHRRAFNLVTCCKPSWLPSS
jgi:hypothetical protein